MQRPFVGWGLMMCGIALLCVSVSPSSDFTFPQRPEVTRMQFLLPQYIPGCAASSNVKSEEDAARVRAIDRVIENLRASYEKKLADEIASLITPLEEYRQLLGDIRQDFDAFETIALTFTIDRIMINGEDVAVHLHWEGEWQEGGRETPLRDRGLSVFNLLGYDQITLRAIDGDSPFGMGRRIKQAPMMSRQS